MSKTSCQTQIHGENNMFYGMTVRQTQHRLMYFSKKNKKKKHYEQCGNPCSKADLRKKNLQCEKCTFHEETLKTKVSVTGSNVKITRKR